MKRIGQTRINIPQKEAECFPFWRFCLPASPSSHEGLSCVLRGFLSLGMGFNCWQLGKGERNLLWGFFSPLDRDGLFRDTSVLPVGRTGEAGRRQEAEVRAQTRSLQGVGSGFSSGWKMAFEGASVTSCGLWGPSTGCQLQGTLQLPHWGLVVPRVNGGGTRPGAPKLWSFQVAPCRGLGSRGRRAAQRPSRHGHGHPGSWPGVPHLHGHLLAHRSAEGRSLSNHLARARLRPPARGPI